MNRQDFLRIVHQTQDEFQKEYLQEKKMFREIIRESQKEIRRQWRIIKQRIYRQRPEVRERMRQYSRRPNVLLKKRLNSKIWSKSLI